jgi:hypothetical protein
MIYATVLFSVDSEIHYKTGFAIPALPCQLSPAESSFKILLQRKAFFGKKAFSSPYRGRGIIKDRKW